MQYGVVGTAIEMRCGGVVVRRVVHCEYDVSVVWCECCVSVV